VCFVAYVTTKAIKRMETYKIRGQSAKSVKKYLLPISFGPSSTSLLHILNEKLESQMKRMGRTSYEFHPVFVASGPSSEEEQARLDSVKEALATRYSKYTLTTADLSDALALEGIDLASVDTVALTKDSTLSPQEQLESLLQSLPSATSRADLKATFLTRLLVSIAAHKSCDAILFGDSTTRLAEKTLTETAKGRGFSLPWQVADGPSSHGITFAYPMRDLLKKEIVAFTSLVKPALTDMLLPQVSVTNVSASSKGTTIDDLMAQYFESVEKNFPSIVANVVRTSSKLKAPAEAGSVACVICGLPVAEGTDGIYGWGGDQSFDARPKESSDREVLCYGCSRSVNG
jgi:cytoplasmic tRNA 2-thiolation protein 2